MLVSNGAFKVIKAVHHIELLNIKQFLTDMDIVYYESSDIVYQLNNLFVILTKEEFDKIPMLEFNFNFRVII